jgi:hypothetical protein
MVTGSGFLIAPRMGVGGPEAVRSVDAVPGQAVPLATDACQPIRVRGLLAARWLTFNVIVLAVEFAVAAWHLAILNSPLVDFVALDASENRVALAGLVGLVIYLVGIVVFLFWFRRAYGNLRPLRGQMSRGPGWAIGAWFIPIANLYLHIWRLSWVAGTIGERVYANMSHSTVTAERWAALAARNA